MCVRKMHSMDLLFVKCYIKSLYLSIFFGFEHNSIMFIIHIHYFVSPTPRATPRKEEKRTTRTYEHEANDQLSQWRSPVLELNENLIPLVEEEEGLHVGEMVSANAACGDFTCKVRPCHNCKTDPTNTKINQQTRVKWSVIDKTKTRLIACLA